MVAATGLETAEEAVVAAPELRQHPMRHTLVTYALQRQYQPARSRFATCTGLTTLA